MVVVVGGTCQIFRTGRNVGVAPMKFPISAILRKGYSNYVRLGKDNTYAGAYCECRRGYVSDYFQSSRESKAASKLTPQEVAFQHVTSESANFADQLDQLDPSSEFDAFFRSLFNLQASHHEVKRSLNNFLNEYDGTINVPDVLSNLALAYQADKFERIQAGIDEAGDDISDLVKLVNIESGGGILVCSNESISLNASEIAKLVQGSVSGFLRKEFKDNLFLQIALESAVKVEVRRQTPALQEILDYLQFPLTDAKRLIAAASVSTTTSTRSKRDLGSTLSAVFKTVLKVLLSPIKTRIDTILDEVETWLVALYVSSTPTNSILASIVEFTNSVVLKALEYVVEVRTFVNNIFEAIYGDSTTSTDSSTNSSDSTNSTSRRKRELQEENIVELYEIPEQHVIRKRSISNILSVIWAVITFIPNTIVFAVQAAYSVYKVLEVIIYIVSLFT